HPPRPTLFPYTTLFRSSHVAHRAGRLHRHLAHLRAQLRSHDGGGRLLDHLLVAPLHAALALAQPDAALVLVGEDLDLHVARAREDRKSTRLNSSHGSIS